MLNIDQTVRTIKTRQYSVRLPATGKDVSDAIFLATRQWESDFPDKSMYDNSLMITTENDERLIVSYVLHDEDGSR